MLHYISYYDDCGRLKESDKITLPAFMRGIQNGEWEDFAHRARQLSGIKLKRYKKTIPGVTISGTFNPGRTDDDLIKHSQFICLDVDSDDNVDVQSRRKALRKDPYVCGFFTSISGQGLAILFKIKPTKHRAAYDNISRYLEEKYNLKADPSCKNVSRIRFVSYDPEAYWDYKKDQFDKIYKTDTPEQANRSAYNIENVVELVEAIESKQKDITRGYQVWYRIGQALAIFGEEGRNLYHRISRFNKKQYNEADTDAQFDNCLDQEQRGQRDVRVGPGTIFYIAKCEGVLLKPGPTYVSNRKRD